MRSLTLCLTTALVTLGCDSGTKPQDVATYVKGWAADGGIKGEVTLGKVQCLAQPSEAAKGEAFKCKGDVEGGGEVLFDALKQTDGSWKVSKQPIVVSSLVEQIIEKRLVELDLKDLKVECGQRVRPAQPGLNFQCAVENALGQVQTAADVTVKNAAGAIESTWVTAIVSSDKIESEIVTWLADKDIEGKPDCGARHRFSKPEATFTCAVAGADKKVIVTMTDFRGNVTLALAD